MQQMLRTSIRSRALALLCLMVLILLAAPVAAQEIKPAQIMTVPPAEVRTVRTLPDFESSIGTTGEPVEVPFRPGMDPAEYTRLKQEAERHSSQQSLRPGGATRLGPSLSEPIPDVSFEGLNQLESGGGGITLIPPDTHGAVGKTQFAEVVNSRFAVFNKETGERLRSVSLNDFFGAPPPPPFSNFLFDPRVVYDLIWNRWVVTAEAFQESPTVQYFYIGVSKTEDATGEFFIYRINVTVVPGEFFDYPQLGLDQDAVIITANIFGTRFGTDVLPIAKARLYNGLSLRIPRFLGLRINTVPPIVLDDNPRTFLIATQPGTPNVFLYALTNSSRPDAAAISGPTPVDVGLYTIPRRARQPDTTATLDTLDARFQNSSRQIGNSLFNVHTINYLDFPTPRWYEIDTAANSVIQRGVFFATASSDDFNPSITVNDDKDVFVTWSSTSARTSREDDSGYYPQVRASGRLQTDPPNEIPAGSVIFQSPTFYLSGRWGDYSAITVDPTNSKCGWGVNEKVNTPTVWGSRIFRSCFPE